MLHAVIVGETWPNLRIQPTPTHAPLGERYLTWSSVLANRREIHLVVGAVGNAR